MRRWILGSLAVGLWVALAWGSDVETRAKAIEGRIMAPCCMTNTVAVHESGVSDRIRAEIREMLADGKSEKEILDAYVAVYGKQILAMPEARGLGLTAYLFPVVFLTLGALALTLTLKRWRRPAPAEKLDTPPAAEPEITGPYAERLRRELEKLD